MTSGKLSARLVLPIILCSSLVASAPGLAMAAHKPTLGGLAPVRPIGRSMMGLAYDTERNELVMFGGFSRRGEHTRAFGDTWTWDGVAWTRHQPTMSPPPRYGLGMVYDPARHEVVLFGGLTKGGQSDQTWTWDGADWTERHPANSPPPGQGPAMAYDPDLAKVVLLEGASSSSTWTWDGTNWTEEHPLGQPTPRSFESSAFDEVNGTFVVFGGYDSFNCGEVPCSLGDTWTWDGVTWTEQHPQDHPSARGSAAAAYDAASGTVVLFGGWDFEFFGDTGTWDGTNWSTLDPLDSPPPRTDASMVFDKALGMVVLFGGMSKVQGHPRTWFNDLWAWDGTNWERIG